MTPVLAHAFGGVKDLPVPLWLFYYAGAAVLVFSFVALGVLWRRPRLGEAAAERPLPKPLQRVLLSPVTRLVLGGAAVALFVLVWLAAALGTADASVNLAPTFVFVLFWIGLVPLVVIFGNVWRVVSPWKAAADGAHWLWARVAPPWRTPFPYPPGLGRWPAVVLLFAFVVFELAYSDPSDPRALALAIWIYSLVTWGGMLVFGREAWLQNGEAFNVYFGLLARVSPFAVQTSADGRRTVVARPPLSALAVDEERRGTLAFVAVMLGSVGFDGVSRTRWWQDLRLEAQADLVLESPGLAELVGTALNVGGILAAAALVALAYLLAVAAAGLIAGARRDLAGAFLLSLVPIALVYVVAHYFSLFVLQGQFAIPLASDPFGRGADLLGTADYEVDLGLLSPNAIWYTQVVALIAGHVAGLVVAHDRAVQLFASARTAIRTQYAMLALMVAYTVGGMWILAQP
ncbi:MAG: fenitrothion hydrolase [Thermoleophilia bacterium]|nr:fenitrothion hydrolase [Thermoleophilia bacterium]